MGATRSNSLAPLVARRAQWSCRVPHRRTYSYHALSSFTEFSSDNLVKVEKGETRSMPLACAHLEYISVRPDNYHFSGAVALEDLGSDVIYGECEPIMTKERYGPDDQGSQWYFTCCRDVRDTSNVRVFDSRERDKGDMCLTVRIGPPLILRNLLARRMEFFLVDKRFGMQFEKALEQGEEQHWHGASAERINCSAHSEGSTKLASHACSRSHVRSLMHLAQSQSAARLVIRLSTRSSC